MTPMLETRARGGSPGLKSFGDAHLTYDMRDSAADNPTMAIQCAAGAEATTYTAAAESPFAKTTDAVRTPFSTGVDSQALSIKFTQTNASSKTEIRALEVDERPFPMGRGGQ